MGGASQSGSKLALISIPTAPAPTDRRVYNFGPVAAADAAAACALLNYTATPNLINLEIVLARSVGQSGDYSTWTLGRGQQPSPVWRIPSA